MAFLVHVRLRSLPRGIVLLAGFFLLLPVAAYFFTAARQALSPLDLPAVLSRWNPYHILLILCSVGIGVGLLRVAKWAYYLFLVFAALLLGYNVYRAVWIALGGTPAPGLDGGGTTPTDLMAGTALMGCAVGALFYFLRKEISVPYLSVAPRGFRRFMRETLPMPLRWETMRGEPLDIAGETVTENISEAGCLMPLPAATPLVPGEPLRLQLVLHYDHSPLLMDVRGEVIRVLAPPREDPDQPSVAGIRFDFPPGMKAEQRRLNDFLLERFAPRYRATGPLHWRFVDGDEAGQESSGGLFNVSARGAYLQSDRMPEPGRMLHLALDQPRLTGRVRVRWTNPMGRWGKPKGFGVEFDALTPRPGFWLWLLRLQWSSFRIR